MESIQGHCLRGLRWMSAFALLLTVFLSPAWAQLPTFSGRTRLSPLGVVQTAATNSDDEDDDLEARFPGGASLKTDPELERLLNIADAYAKEGRFNVATELWQKALNETGDTLITRDGRIYHSLSEDIEQVIAQLPAAGLRVYRLRADGEAQAILGEPGRDRQDALSEVVQKYFVSAYGDDAAFELACLALDQHDFIGASRLLNKILSQHPDPSIAKSELLMRMSVANAQLGDHRGAQNAIEQAKAQSERLASATALDLVSSHVRELRSSEAEFIAAGDAWRMRLGNGERTGEMKPLPQSVMASQLTELWGYEYPLSLYQFSAGQSFGSTVKAAPKATATSAKLLPTSRAPAVSSAIDSSSFRGRTRLAKRVVAPFDGAYRGGFGGGFGGTRSYIVGPGGVPNGQGQQSLKAVVDRWRAKKWQPAGEMLVADGRIYHKTNTDLICWNADGSSDRPLWRTVWWNMFRPDTMTQSLMSMGMFGPHSEHPVSPAEIMLFGDRIHQSMSVIDNVVYSIEGKRFGRGENGIGVQQPQLNIPFGSVPRRTRQNWLAAYEADTGRYLWYRSASEVDSESEEEDAALASEVGFLGAPVPFGNFLIAPLSKDGVTWLIALDRATGKTVWRSYLCDEPAAGSPPWSAVQVAVAGRDVYVTCGSGVVFAVDAVSGSIRMAVRYQRSVAQNSENRAQNAMAAFSLDGWSEDVVIPVGKALVVTASDHDGLFAIDRRTGEVLWNTLRSPFGNPANYVLGVHGDQLFVAGDKEVRCYDVPQGKLLWVADIDGGFGRGVLTSDAIYVPEMNAIKQLNLKTGDIEATTSVSLTADQPIGNLFSDGEKLWSVGVNRVYALTSLENRMELLADQIAAKNPEAYLERMQLRMKLQQHDGAVDDLANAIGLIRERNGPAEALSVLVENWREIELPRLNARRAIEMLSLARAELSEAEIAESETQIKQSEQLFFEAFEAVDDLGDDFVKTEIFEAVRGSLPFLSQDRVIRRAGQTLGKIFGPREPEALVALLKSDDAVVQRVAIIAAAGYRSDDIQEMLTRHMNSENEQVKLASARAVLNLDDRKALPIIIELLSAESIAVRRSAVDALRSASEQRFDFSPSKSAEERSDAIAKWKKWVDEKGAEAELKLPLPEGPILLGRTLIAYYSQNVIVELDADNNEVWRKQLPTVWSVQGLSNGHRLASIYGKNKVIEYDEKGEEFWSVSNLPGNPFSVRRLDNGNTLIACSDSELVVEVDPQGEYVNKIRVAGRPMDAQRLDDGNTIVCLANSNRVVEVDSKGGLVKVVASNMPGAISVERLENGNTLIVTQNNGTVVEVDEKGQTVWSRKNLSQPYDVQRLENGNTLIADNNAVIEVTRDGEVVWKRTSNGASSVSRF